MSGSQVVLRVNVTKGQYDIYKDTIWVNYSYKEGEKRILEKDVINLWGQVKGRKTYSAVLGTQITIPEIDSRFTEIVGKSNP